MHLESNKGGKKPPPTRRRGNKQKGRRKEKGGAAVLLFPQISSLIPRMTRGTHKLHGFNKGGRETRGENIGKGVTSQADDLTNMTLNRENVPKGIVGIVSHALNLQSIEIPGAGKREGWSLEYNRTPPGSGILGVTTLKLNQMVMK